MSEFDPIAARYDELVARSIAFGGQEHEHYTRRKADALVDLASRQLGDPSRLRVLDVGCGIGLTDGMLAGRFGELHGVDLSESAVERAAAANRDVEYRSFDGARLPYDDDAFDLVFAICVVHHVDVSERVTFAMELGRVIRPGGIAAVFEHNPRNPLTRIAVSRCDFDEDVTLLGRRRASKLLRAGGLEPVDERFIIFLPFERRWSSALERRLKWLPLGAQYYVAARK
ncbi:MAG: class I SAM-dependent methyltransferase [Acidimicrobiia bacterium]|nr:class I SAM-dependent methyltransferase [Acidimicrobiia bacterium]